MQAQLQLLLVLLLPSAQQHLWRSWWQQLLLALLLQPLSSLPTLPLLAPQQAGEHPLLEELLEVLQGERQEGM